MNSNVVQFPNVEKELNDAELEELEIIFEADPEYEFFVPSCREEFLLYLSEVLDKEDYYCFLEACLIPSLYALADEDLQDMADHYWSLPLNSACK